MINNKINIRSEKIGTKAIDLNSLSCTRKAYIKEIAVPVTISAFYYKLGFDRFFNTRLKIIF